jgi:hypothetical protein
MWSVGGSQVFQFVKLFVVDVIRPRFSTPCDDFLMCSDFCSLPAGKAVQGKVGGRRVQDAVFSLAQPLCGCMVTSLALW